MTVKINGPVNSCVFCEYKELISNPKPKDWRHKDDMAVLCTRKKNPNRDENSKNPVVKSAYMSVVISARPHTLVKESPVPEWCPERRI